jgi:DNA-binding NtrC family response regulator
MVYRGTKVIAAGSAAGRSHVICILLIETDRAAVVLLNRILTEYGCSVTSVQSSSEIEEALDAAQFDLILLGASPSEDIAAIQDLISRPGAAPLTVLSTWLCQNAACTTADACLPQGAVRAALTSRIEALRCLP